MTFPANDSLNTYGGALNNYGVGVVDPTTDRDAGAANKAYGSVAAMTLMCPIAWLRFTTSASVPTLTASNAAWGNDVSIQPVVVRNTTGVFVVTWPASVTDILGATYNLNIRRVSRPNVESSTGYNANAVLTAANQITVYTFNAAGSANDIAGTVVYLDVGG